VGRLMRVLWSGVLLAGAAAAEEALPDAEMLMFLAEFADDSGDVVDPEALLDAMTPVAQTGENETQDAAPAISGVTADEENDDVDL